eukprot:1194988-Prorocentrum_minimum.AAC.5
MASSSRRPKAVAQWWAGGSWRYPPSRPRRARLSKSRNIIDRLITHSYIVFVRRLAGLVVTNVTSHASVASSMYAATTFKANMNESSRREIPKFIVGTNNVNKRDKNGNTSEQQAYIHEDAAALLCGAVECGVWTVCTGPGD